MSKTKSIMHYSHNISRKEKFALITQLLSEEKIRNLLECENHSFGMIKDLLSRDYLNSYTNEIMINIIRAKQHQTFATILKDNNLTFNLKNYNKMPQHWKLQYRFPKDWSIEQIQTEINKSSSEGQKTTVKNRINNGSYHSVIFDKKWSPFVVDFYTSKGWSENEAIQRIKQICSNGAKAALKVVQKPATEAKISQILEQFCKSFSTQFVIKNDCNEDKRKSFIYDFLLPETKTIIEVNGDFFHANPAIYSKNDVIPLPSGLCTAQELWEKDKRKIDFARSKGYTVIVIWEHEIKYRLNETKERLFYV
jgi:G:T-mismatch repair DNA endonuclease (very short patch repair protein)